MYKIRDFLTGEHLKRERENRAIYQRTSKISFLFLVIFAGMAVFLFAIFDIITKERRIPAHNATVYDRAFRGNIISADGYTLSTSRKSYKAVVRGASIVPEKREVFVKLFSIYSGISEKEIRKRFKDKRGKPRQGTIVLSKRLDFQAASQLKSLAYILRRLGVFQYIKNRSGYEVLYGLEIIETGESRHFPKREVLSPALGYVGKKVEKNYVRPKGIKGLEKRYETHIASKRDGFLRGKRDVSGAIIHDKNTIDIKRVDGLDLYLNIPLTLQHRIELMIDHMREEIDADEILVGIMESDTGKVLALATTRRYNPAHIRQRDIPALDPHFTEYPYEPGSVMKPITLAIALDHHVVTPHTIFNTGYHTFYIGKNNPISDDDYIESQSAADIIVHSSNIGISKISWLLDGKAYRDGVLKFGFTQPSGIDLSRELTGSLKPLHLLNHKTHRANSAYGYGIEATFAQLFKAYSAFNNDGIAVTPRIADYLQDAKGHHYTPKPKVDNLKAISKKSAHDLHNILIEVVKRGTGIKAQYPGLEVGGKTGTARIAKNGGYVSEYHSSFFGFANDKKGHKYTIGVLAIRPKAYRKFFASQSAVPTFKNAVRLLVSQGYLYPDPTEAAKAQPTQETPLYDRPDHKAATPPKQNPVKDLFKPDQKPNSKHKKSEKKRRPASQQSPHELFEDLF